MWRRKIEAAKERTNCSLQKHSSVTLEWISESGPSLFQRDLTNQYLSVLSASLFLLRWNGILKASTKELLKKQLQQTEETVCQRSSIKLRWAAYSSQSCCHISCRNSCLFPAMWSSLKYLLTLTRTSQMEKKRFYCRLEMADLACILWSTCYRVHSLKVLYPDFLPISSLLSTKFLKLSSRWI